MVEDNKHYLLSRLNIRDFICKYSALEVLDLRESYYLTSYAMQHGINNQIKSQLASQGITPETLSAIFDIDENLLATLLNEHSNVLEDFNDENLSDEYKKSRAKISEIEGLLNNSNTLTLTEKKTLENEIIEARRNLNTIKGNELQLKFQNNPQLLFSNPKAIKSIVDLISKTTEIKPIMVDENNTLLKLQKKIEELFILGKKEEHQKLQIEPPTESGLSKKDFLELLIQIGNEEDNMCTAESINFFMNMKS